MWLLQQDGRFRSTMRSTKRVVLHDFGGLRRTPRVCKSLTNLRMQGCHGILPLFFGLSELFLPANGGADAAHRRVGRHHEQQHGSHAHGRDQSRAQRHVVRLERSPQGEAGQQYHRLLPDPIRPPSGGHTGRGTIYNQITFKVTIVNNDDIRRYGFNNCKARS